MGMSSGQKLATWSVVGVVSAHDYHSLSFCFNSFILDIDASLINASLAHFMPN
jgi:hypothetical protein